MKKTLTILAIALTMNAFAQIPTTGLVAHYPFTGNANDISGSGNNGTVTGATLTTDRFGNANFAYLFNGSNQWIDVIDSTNLNPSTQLTISVWVESSATQLNAGIIGKWNNFNGSIGDGQEQYVILADGQGMNFVTKTTIQKTTTEPSVLYNNGNWHHFVGVWDGAVMKLYRDNVLVSSIAQTGSIPSFTQKLEIGRYAGGQGTGANQNYFSGKIDDIRIYNVAVDSTGINALYNEGVCYTNISVTDTLVINTGITGYNPISYSNTIKIYPNPANDHVTINYGNYTSMNGYTMKITNSLGQTVFTTPISQQTSYVALSTWSGSGLYFVYIIDGTGNTIDIKKIVLQ